MTTSDVDPIKSYVDDIFKINSHNYTTAATEKRSEKFSLFALAYLYKILMCAFQEANGSSVCGTH